MKNKEKALDLVLKKKLIFNSLSAFNVFFLR